MSIASSFPTSQIWPEETRVVLCDTRDVPRPEETMELSVMTMYILTVSQPIMFQKFRMVAQCKYYLLSCFTSTRYTIWEPDSSLVVIP